MWKNCMNQYTKKARTRFVETGLFYETTYSPVCRCLAGILLHILTLKMVLGFAEHNVKTMPIKISQLNA